MINAIELKILSIIQSTIILFFLISTSPGLAQQKKKDSTVIPDQYVLKRIKNPLKLDGMSVEQVWMGIEPFPVTTHRPVFGHEPSEKTEVFLAFDDDYLYVAGRLFDSEPMRIQASSKKRDSTNLSNDWFGIIIDSFNDKENALGFFTNPSGLRNDCTISNDNEGSSAVNLSWNTFWDVVAVRNQEGWFVEMRIPFSSLRFQDREGRVVMGLIIWRLIPRKHEIVTFPPISQKWGERSSWKPSQAQEVVLEGVYSRKPLYITPYVLSGVGQNFELNENKTAYRRIDDLTYDAGLDVKYGLTTNLTLDFTLNTDFAQVEADDEQVNLTRFSLFFPEKRLFFQERSSTFNFNLDGPNQLFYSRRIGIHENKEVSIYGGVRLVGRLGSWDLGFIDIQTAPIEDLPSENFGVLRFRRRVFNPYSYVGGMITSRIGLDGSYNITYGFDGIFRLFGDDYLNFCLAQTFETDQEKNLFSLDPTRLWINWERRAFKGVGYNLSYSRAGLQYNPGIGFEMRSDYTRFGNRLSHGWILGEGSILMNHQLFLDGLAFLRNSDNQVESAELGPGWLFTTKSGFQGTIAAKYFYEDILESFDLSDSTQILAGQYTFYGLNCQYSTPPGRLFHIMTNLDASSFYDGWRLSLSSTSRWNISSSLELEGTYQINYVTFPGRNQEFTAHIVRLRTIYMLSTKFSATAFVQYNSAIDVVIANIRLRYNPREGNDVYLVYNEGFNTDRCQESPTLPYTSGRTIMIKYSYTFNY